MHTFNKLTLNLFRLLTALSLQKMNYASVLLLGPGNPLKFFPSSNGTYLIRVACLDLLLSELPAFGMVACLDLLAQPKLPSAFITPVQNCKLFATVYYGAQKFILSNPTLIENVKCNVHIRVFQKDRSWNLTLASWEQLKLGVETSKNIF